MVKVFKKSFVRKKKYSREKLIRSQFSQRQKVDLENILNSSLDIRKRMLTDYLLSELDNQLIYSERLVQLIESEIIEVENGLINP